MKYFFLIFGALMVFGLGVPGQANACSATDPSACTTAQWQATRAPYTGATSPRQVETCVRLLASSEYANLTEIVVVAGTDAVNGRVITSLGRGNGHSFSLRNQPEGTADVYVREFCFEGHLIAGLDAITFCNGMNRGDGNHHTLSLHDETAPYLRNLQRTGHVGDFLSLLGEVRTYSGPVPSFFTSRLYDRLYGRHGEWVGG